MPQIADRVALVLFPPKTNTEVAILTQLWVFLVGMTFFFFFLNTHTHTRTHLQVSRSLYFLPRLLGEGGGTKSGRCESVF